MDMPGGDSFFGSALLNAVQSGVVPESRIDDMATRILAAWYYLGQDSPDYPSINFDSRDPLNEATNAHVDVQADHAKIVKDIGVASTILLKNERGALPLKKPRNLVVIGLLFM